MTFDGGAKADYVVGQVWARKGPNVYLLDQVRDQMRFTEQRKAALRLARKWHEVRRWLIENKANGAAIIDTLRRPLTREDGVDDEDQTGLPGVIPVNPKEPKIVRAEAVASYFEAGNVVLPHPSIAPWVAEFIEELTAFPTGGHDDQVDACAQALRDIYRASAVTSGVGGQHQASGTHGVVDGLALVTGRIVTADEVAQRPQLDAGGLGDLAADIRLVFGAEDGHGDKAHDRWLGGPMHAAVAARGSLDGVDGDFERGGFGHRENILACQRARRNILKCSRAEQRRGLGGTPRLSIDAGG